MKDNHYYSLIVAAISLFFLLDGFIAPAVSSAKDNYFIQKFDKDKDGKISKEEYPGSDSSFDNRDKNNDGYLDENEASKGPMSGRSEKEKRGSGYIRQFDRDKDGKISREEYRGSDSAFDNWDKNNDGFIDEDETPKGPSGMRPPEGQRGGGYIRHFDKDKDGKISREEYRGSDSSFKNQDKNNDGFIDENEARKGPSGMKPPEGQRGGGYIHRFDKDKDGKISREEYRGSDSSFKNRDKNNDGYLDNSEIYKRQPSKTEPARI